MMMMMTSDDDEDDDDDDDKPTDTVPIKSTVHKSSKRLATTTRSRRKANARNKCNKRKRKEIENSKCDNGIDIVFHSDQDVSDSIDLNDDPEPSIIIDNIYYDKQEPARKRRKIEQKEIAVDNGHETMINAAQM